MQSRDTSLDRDIQDIKEIYINYSDTAWKQGFLLTVIINILTLSFYELDCRFYCRDSKSGITPPH